MRTTEDYANQIKFQMWWTIGWMLVIFFIQLITGFAMMIFALAFLAGTTVAFIVWITLYFTSGGKLK